MLTIHTHALMTYMLLSKCHDRMMTRRPMRAIARCRGRWLLAGATPRPGALLLSGRVRFAHCRRGRFSLLGEQRAMAGRMMMGGRARRRQLPAAVRPISRRRATHTRLLKPRSRVRTPRHGDFAAKPAAHGTRFGRFLARRGFTAFMTYVSPGVAPGGHRAPRRRRR